MPDVWRAGGRGGTELALAALLPHQQEALLKGEQMDQLAFLI